MNKAKKIFKTITLAFICFAIPLTIFLLISFILTLFKISVLNNLHFIFFLILIAITLTYLLYLTIILIKNRNKK